MAWGTGTLTRWSAGRSQATSPVLEALKLKSSPTGGSTALRAAQQAHGSRSPAEGTRSHATGRAGGSVSEAPWILATAHCQHRGETDGREVPAGDRLR